MKRVSGLQEAVDLCTTINLLRWRWQRKPRPSISPATAVSTTHGLHHARLELRTACFCSRKSKVACLKIATSSKRTIHNLPLVSVSDLSSGFAFCVWSKSRRMPSVHLGELALEIELS